MSRQLKLGAFLMATGHHVAAWRHPDVPANAGLDFAQYKRLAQIAEAAKFDALFVADSIAAAKAAREVAAHIGTVHHELHFTVQEGIDALGEVIVYAVFLAVTLFLFLRPVAPAAIPAKSLSDA